MAKSKEALAYPRVQTVCLVALTLIALGVALYLLKPVLVPFVLAVFLTYCLTPLIDVQRRTCGCHGDWRSSRPWSWHWWS